jgi:hypothetical protein
VSEIEREKEREGRERETGVSTNCKDEKEIHGEVGDSLFLGHKEHQKVSSQLFIGLLQPQVLCRLTLQVLY